ncbi:MAG: histidine kinase, partial [Marinirhabdus sp.]
MYRFLKELGKAVLIGTLVFLVICIVGFATGGFVFSAKRLLVQYGYNQLYAVPIYFANVYF